VRAVTVALGEALVAVLLYRLAVPVATPSPAVGPAAGSTSVRSRCGRQPAAALETTAAGWSWAIFGTVLDWSRLTERSPAAPTAAHIATLLTGGLSACWAAVGSASLAKCRTPEIPAPVDSVPSGFETVGHE
jgi:hypothetical protein